MPIRLDRPRSFVALAAAPVLVATAVTVPAITAVAGPSARAAAKAPSYTRSTVVSGLSNPWDLSFMGDLMIYDQRAGGLYSKRGSAKPKKITTAKMPKLFAGSESGMMGLVVDPDWKSNKYFYTCQSVAKSNGKDPDDIRVLRWKLDSDTHATVSKTMVDDLPISSGRHGGCRLRFSVHKYLYIGTGDAAVGTNPQNLKSLGGKVLRLTHGGNVPKANPFRSKGGNARYVWNYGHRNVQGLALRPGTNTFTSVEQGTTRDDEVNRVTKGANYGYNPVPGYNESVPMTDTKKYPKAKKAAWRSGSSTIATSGATYLSGSKWKSWNGALAVGVLKDQQIKLFSVSKDSTSAKPLATITNLNGRHRIRTVQLGPDGSLYYTTSDGKGDVIGKLTPR